MIFVINQGKHGTFTREGDNLHTELEVTLKEALLGFEKQIKHLDDHLVEVYRDQVTQPGFIIKIEGEGMPKHEKSGEFGDLYVKIKVLFPESLTEEQIKSKLYLIFSI